MTAMTDKVLHLARAGVTYREIAERTGVPLRRAGELARRAGIHRKPVKNPAWTHYSADDKRRACDMYIDGCPMEEISTAVKAADNTIRQWLDRAGIKRRASGRRGVFDGARIRELRGRFTVAAVAEIMECTPGTVWYHCKVSR